MHSTPIPTPEPIAVVAALAVLLLSILVAGMTVALARRVLRKATMAHSSRRSRPSPRAVP